MLQIHMPVLEPSTVLQLALFKETGPRGTRKSVMAGLLRLRLNSLTSEVDHSAELPMCASRKQGGEKVATLGLSIKVCFHDRPLKPPKCMCSDNEAGLQLPAACCQALLLNTRATQAPIDTSVYSRQALLWKQSALRHVQASEL